MSLWIIGLLWSLLVLFSCCQGSTTTSASEQTLPGDIHTQHEIDSNQKEESTKNITREQAFLENIKETDIDEIDPNRTEEITENITANETFFENVTKTQEIDINQTEEVTRNITENQTSLENKLNVIETQLAAIDANLRVKDKKVETLLNCVCARQTWMKDLVKPPRAEYETTCVRHMARKKPMEKMLLWGTIETWCDTETYQGGWIVIQRRSRGNVNFVRDWKSYKNGFGTPDTDFWIGNDVIHNLTSQGYTELLIEMKMSGNNNKYYAQYSRFYVSDEVSNYQLTVSGYSGNATDSLAFHNGSYFSTDDRDNNLNQGSCASTLSGGWWYKGGSSSNYQDCYKAHLNGVWQEYGPVGVFWKGIRSRLTFTEMKVRI